MRKQYIFLVMGLLFLVGCGTESVMGESKEQDDSVSKVNLEMTNSVSMSEKDLLDTLVKYNTMFERMEPEVDYNDFSEEHVGYKFKTIQTKEQLYSKFSDFMTAEAAEYLWVDFVNEGEDGLYLIPKDGHPKFNEEDPYSIERVNDTMFQIRSEHVSDLYGYMDMLFTFTKQGSGWIITEVEFK